MKGAVVEYPQRTGHATRVTRHIKSSFHGIACFFTIEGLRLHPNRQVHALPPPRLQLAWPALAVRSVFVMHASALMGTQHCGWDHQSVGRSRIVLPLRRAWRPIRELQNLFGRSQSRIPTCCRRSQS
eukprot:scaffold48_cov311-Pinguiococcus_pyrenoidosus.AAC.235